MSVSLISDRDKIRTNESANITTNVEGGKPPYKVKWKGDYEGEGNTAVFNGRKAGIYHVTAEVTDSKSGKASESLTITVVDSTPKKPDTIISKTPEVPVYDPTKDTNVSSSSSKNIDIAEVENLGNEFQGAQTGVKPKDPPKDNQQTPVAQSDTYTGSTKKPEDSSADIPPYPPFQSDNTKTAGKDWTDWVKTNSSGSNSSGSNSSLSAKCDPSQKQTAYKEGYKCGQKAKQNSNKITSDCQPIPQAYMNKDNKMGWGSCLYSGFDEGYRAGLGTTTSSTPGEVIAELENRSAENVHIFVEGQDNFGPHNKLKPGEKPKKVSIKVPKGGGVVKFIAGRDGQKLAECTWEYTPDSSTRVPVVKFSAPKSLTCVTGLR